MNCFASVSVSNVPGSAFLHRKEVFFLRRNQVRGIKDEAFSPKKAPDFVSPCCQKKAPRGFAKSTLSKDRLFIAQPEPNIKKT